jgi:hypothetical protein
MRLTICVSHLLCHNQTDGSEVGRIKSLGSDAVSLGELIFRECFVLPDPEGTTVFRNVGKYLPVDMTYSPQDLRLYQQHRCENLEYYFISIVRTLLTAF